MQRMPEDCMVGLFNRIVRLRGYDWFWPAFFFAGLSIALLWRAVASGGFVFLLDMPWPASFQLADYIRSFDAHGNVTYVFGSGTIWNVLLGVVGVVISPAFVQKCVLFAVLWVASFGMWRLANGMYARLSSSSIASPLAYLSGLLYIMNPYVMDRLWAGHWRVLAGYALLPFLVRWIIVYINSKGQTGVYRLGILYAVLPTLSLHWWFMCSLIALPVFVYTMWKTTPPQKKTLYKGMLRIALLWTMVNFGWVVYAVAVRSPVAGLESSDASLFGAVTTMPGGIVATILSGGGFWYHPFYFAAGADRLWVGISILLLGLSLIALRQLYRKNRVCAAYIAIVWLMVVAVCVLSANSAGIRIVTDLLALPGFVGLREVTKMVGIVVFCYAIAAPYGVGWLLMRLEWHALVRPIVVMFVAVIVLAMNTAFFADYLHATRYPASWYGADAYLQRVQARKVLVLPYVGYMRLSFAGDRFVANPARAFFGVPVILGTSTGNFMYDTDRAVHGGDVAMLAQYIQDGAPSSSLLAQTGIDYILVLKSAGQVPTDETLEAAGLQVAFTGDDCLVLRTH